MSFYLKYRPQKVADLDLVRVREFFETILKSGKVAHAYLFTGPRGTGKTSAARILAKVVNCVKNTKKTKITTFGEPCNRCLMCKSITDGSMVDLVEIDAASNRGIDDIRDLREKIGLAPVGAKFKVYIIDEVHMLTLEAFNALLKTLEEPPRHAIFVLATTEPHKIPETIVSRCVRLVFPKAGKAEVVRSLKRVARGEKLKVEKAVLEELAMSVDGSFREAVKVLEQLSLKKGKITLEKAKQELGRSGLFSPAKFLKLLVAGKVEETVGELERLSHEGVKWRVFLDEGLRLLRSVLLGVLGVDRAGDEQARIDFRNLSKEQTLFLIELFLKAGRDMRDMEDAQLALEIVVAEWGSSSKFKVQSSKTPKEKSEGKAEVLSEKEELAKRQHSVTRSVKSDVNVVKLKSKWLDVLKEVRPFNHSLEGLLRSTRPVAVTGDKLMVEVFYQFHLDQLKQEKFLAAVEEAVGKVLAGQFKIEYQLGKRPTKQMKQHDNIETAAVEDEDIIKVAEEVFGVE